MRHPQRIGPVAAAMTRAWSAYPDQRLGQFIANVAMGTDPWHIEEDEWLRRFGLVSIGGLDSLRDALQAALDNGNDPAVTDDLVERVAAAIHAVEYPAAGEHGWASTDEGTRDVFRQYARAAVTGQGGSDERTER